MKAISQLAAPLKFVSLGAEIGAATALLENFLAINLIILFFFFLNFQSSRPDFRYYRVNAFE